MVYSGQSIVYTHYDKKHITIKPHDNTNGYSLVFIPFIDPKENTSIGVNNVTLLKNIECQKGSKLFGHSVKAILQSSSDDVHPFAYGKVYGSFGRATEMMKDGDVTFLKVETAEGSDFRKVSAQDTHLTNGVIDIKTDPEKRKWFGRVKERMFFAGTPWRITNYGLPKTCRRVVDGAFFGVWILNMSDTHNLEMDYTIQFKELPLLAED